MVFGKTKGKYFSREGWTSERNWNRKSRSEFPRRESGIAGGPGETGGQYPRLILFCRLAVSAVFVPIASWGYGSRHSPGRPPFVSVRVYCDSFTKSGNFNFPSAIAFVQTVTCLSFCH